jgi:hypothetical protein
MRTVRTMAVQILCYFFNSFPTVSATVLRHRQTVIRQSENVEDHPVFEWLAHPTYRLQTMHNLKFFCVLSTEDHLFFARLFFIADLLWTGGLGPAWIYEFVMG